MLLYLVPRLGNLIQLLLDPVHSLSFREGDRQWHTGQFEIQFELDEGGQLQGLGEHLPQVTNAQADADLHAIII